MYEPSIFFEHLSLLVGGLIANVLLAGPRQFWQRLPFPKLSRMPMLLVRRLGEKLNRDKRSLEDRRQRGWIVGVSLIALALFFGALMSALIPDQGFGLLLESLLIGLCINVRQTTDAALDIKTHLEKDDPAKARDILEETGVWRNAALLDANGIARAAIETVAVHTAEKAVSPALWFICFGLPGLFVARIVTTLEQAIGHNRDGFGRAAIWLSLIVHFIPSILTSLFFGLAAFFLPFCKPIPAMKLWTLYFPVFTNRHKVIGILGTGMNVALAGPSSVYAPPTWLGGTVTRIFPRDILRSVWLSWIVMLILLLGLGIAFA